MAQGRMAARLGAASRVLAGTVGSYALAAVAAAALARLLPGERIEAVIAATLASLLLIPAATLWAFAAPGPRQAWAGLAGVAAALALCAWLAGRPH
jgi:hypothetical protein